MARSSRALPTHGPGGVVPDPISKQIIEQLQQDGRRSYAAIGKAVGLSEAAVRQRVQRLQDTGVMQIVAVTDPLTVGFLRQAMIAINTDGDLEKVAGQLADLIPCMAASAASRHPSRGHVTEIVDQLRSVDLTVWGPGD